MCPSNYNRFWDRARYWSKIVIFSYPLAFDALVRGVPLRRSSWNFERCTKSCKNIAEKFNRLSREHERHRQTDRQTTDTIAVPLAEHNVVTFGWKLERQRPPLHLSDVCCKYFPYRRCHGKQITLLIDRAMNQRTKGVYVGCWKIMYCLVNENKVALKLYIIFLCEICKCNF